MVCDIITFNNIVAEELEGWKKPTSCFYIMKIIKIAFLVIINLIKKILFYGILQFAETERNWDSEWNVLWITLGITHQMHHDVNYTH